MGPPHPSRRAPRYVCVCRRHICWRPPQDEAGKILGVSLYDSFPPKSALMLIALLAQRRIEQLRRAVLDLPPVAVAIDEIERIGAVAEARLLHAAEAEVLLPRVDLLECVINRRLAR